MRTRNPARLAEVSAAERDAWEEAQEEKRQRLAERRAGVARERQRQKEADLKRFRLRGFRGKGVPGNRFEDEERDTALTSVGVPRTWRQKRIAMEARDPQRWREAVARRKRMASGSEVQGPYAKFTSTPQSRRAPEPWERRKPAGTKKSAVELPQRHEIRKMINRWHTTGELPRVDAAFAVGPVEELRPIEKKRLKVMGEAWARAGVAREVIEALLIRGGVEENPGPETTGEKGAGPCMLQGKEIYPAWNGQRGKFVPECPTCHVPLGKLVYGKFSQLCQRDEKYRHPVVDAEAYVMKEASKPSCSHPCDPVRVAGEKDDVDVIDLEALDKLPSPPAQAVKQSPPPPPPSPAPAAAPPPAPLKGHELTQEEAVDFMVSRHFCSPSSVQVEKRVAHYVGERRIVADRTIKETKQDMEYVHLSGYSHDCKIPVFRSLLNALLFVLCEDPKLEYLVWLPMMLLPVIVFVEALLTWSWFFFWAFTVIAFPWLVLLSAASAWAAHFYMRPLNKAVKKFQTFFRDMVSGLWTPVHVYYVPHAVTCVVNTYQAGTSYKVVSETIGQRLSRLGTLPIPDEAYARLVAGTTEVGIWVVERQPFFDLALGAL